MVKNGLKGDIAWRECLAHARDRPHTAESPGFPPAAASTGGRGSKGASPGLRRVAQVTPTPRPSERKVGLPEILSVHAEQSSRQTQSMLSFFADQQAGRDAESRADGERRDAAFAALLEQQRADSAMKLQARLLITPGGIGVFGSAADKKVRCY